jgi:hypothetical protein
MLARQYGIGFQNVLQLLLLVVQQLQGLAPSQRAAFLHSPAGVTVLQVLRQVPMEYEDSLPLAFVVLSGGPQGGAAILAQQQGDTEGGWMYEVQGRTLVEQLLLPALLLQPARADGTQYSCSTSVNPRTAGSAGEAASGSEQGGDHGSGNSINSTASISREGGRSSSDAPSGSGHQEEGCSLQRGALEAPPPPPAAAAAVYDRMVMMYGAGAWKWTQYCLIPMVHHQPAC